MKKKMKFKESQLIVPVLRWMVHALPVEPTRRRHRCTNYVRELPICWGQIQRLKIEAPQPLNVFDFLSLLTVSRLALVNQQQLKDGGTFGSRKAYLLTVSRYRFIKERHLPASGASYPLALESLSRLANATWTYYLPQPTKIKIILCFKEETGKWLLFINKKYVDLLQTSKDVLKIDLCPVYKCSSDIGRLLCIWLQGQKGHSFSETTLIHALHLFYSRKQNARIKIRQAFSDVQQRGGLIKTWEEVRKDHEIYFRFTRS